MPLNPDCERCKGTGLVSHENGYGEIWDLMCQDCFPGNHDWPADDEPEENHHSDFPTYAQDEGPTVYVATWVSAESDAGVPKWYERPWVWAVVGVLLLVGAFYLKFCR